MQLFISHIKEEAALAQVLKFWIESTFHEYAAFVSSDKNDIPLGEVWFKKISEALEETNLMLVLCSPQSIKRPWINFEAGCGYMKHVPIIPACHSGQMKDALDRPLSDFQAIEISDAASCKDLFEKGIAKHLGKSRRVPPIDYGAMASELDTAWRKIGYKQSEKTQSADPPPTSILASEEQIDEDLSNSEALAALEDFVVDAERQQRGRRWAPGHPHEDGTLGLGWEILRAIEKASRNGKKCTAESLVDNVLNNPTAVKYFLDLLLKHKLICGYESSCAPTGYELTVDGRARLIKKGYI